MAQGTITAARVERVAGLPDAVAVVLEHKGALSPERLRLYFDTKPKAGEPSSGADFLMEGLSFYAYPENGDGWAWTRVGSPVFQATDGRLVCIVSAEALKRPFSWFAEVTTADWNVGQRWPASGATSVDPAKLRTMERPAKEASVDMKPFLAMRPKTLSVALAGGPKFDGWTPVDGKIDFALTPERRASLGLPESAGLQATLRDAVSGEAV